jgi:hypothetical protein
MGELATRWTVRLSLLLYAAAVTARWTGRTTPATRSAARAAWTAACALTVVHTLCAFAFFHAWSHTQAYAHTAQRTAETMGVAWGGGLYWNYALVAIWCGDVLWWWFAPRSYLQRSGLLELAVQAFLAFMWLNAAVVFVSGPGRWLGAAVFLFLGGLIGRALWRRQLAA